MQSLPKIKLNTDLYFIDLIPPRIYSNDVPNHILTFYASWIINRHYIRNIFKKSLNSIELKTIWKGNKCLYTAKDIFWKFIFTKTNIYISDSRQTPDGKRFCELPIG